MKKPALSGPLTRRKKSRTMAAYLLRMANMPFDPTLAGWLVAIVILAWLKSIRKKP